MKIEEIGSFSASLTLHKGVEPEEAEGGTRRNAASLYQQSQRLSAVSILTPSLYTGTDENQIYLRNTLNQVEPKFILVNNHIQLLPDVDTKISKNYKETNLKLSHFKLYQLQ